MLRHHLFIIIGQEHYNPLGIIRSLGQCGIQSVFIAIKGKSTVSSRSKYISRCHFVDSPEEAYQILMAEYSGQKEKPFVLTSDDDIQSLLDMDYERLNEQFILFNAGANGRITQYMDKMAILELAKKHGLNVLGTVVAEHGTVPENISYPIITKSISPNIGGWKSDVHICSSPKELGEAYQHILSPKVLLQEFIEKKNEYCLDGFSVNRGRKVFIPIASTYNYLIRGYYSPYMTVYPFQDKGMSAALQAMLSEIGFEGIFSIEFLIGPDGRYYFSEINFRHSTWGYIAAKLGMPLPYLWAEAMLSGEINKNWHKPIPDGYTAMVEPIDYGKRVESGRISQADWLMDLKRTDCLFYLDWDDPEPFREMVKNWGKLS
jgi:D-aspartate ligase